MKTTARLDATHAPLVRRWSALVLLALAPMTAVGGETQTDRTEAEWTVLIVAANDPFDRLVPPPPADADAPAVVSQANAYSEPVALQANAAAGEVEIVPAVQPLTVNDRTYDEVYRSIPYSYTEYLANPGYRHEATMEILFGQLRPTTVHRHYEPEVIVNDLPSPYQPYRFSHPEYRQYRAPAFRLLNPGCCW